MMWGIVPAAGAASRMQPLAFSKELLPVGSRTENGGARPRAVGEYLLDRMVAAGATRIALVVAPGKYDIVQYFGDRFGPAALCYVVQPQPLGLCDALFRALPFVADDEDVLIGLPDTVWFPEDGFARLPAGELSMLTFHVERPELFDAVVADDDGRVREVQVKRADAASRWVWGALRMPGAVLARLHRLWMSRRPRDEYLGTLFNAHLAEGGGARAVPAGRMYLDVGTPEGYLNAIECLRAGAV